MKTQTLTRYQLVELVQKICACQGCEQELDEMLNLLAQNVPHPRVSDLIFWPEEELSAQEIVDRALSYQRVDVRQNTGNDAVPER